MPRTPDTTCGTCGKPCFKTRAKAGSAWIPPLTHTCRDCRRADVKHGKPSTYKKRGCRCDLCRQAWNEECRIYQAASRARSRPTRQCVECGGGFIPRSNQILCSPACRSAHLGRLGDDRSRATYYGCEYERIDRHQIYARDGWICGICALPVDRSTVYPDPGSASLDHIIPMSRGGGHVASNVQLAHVYCNSVKGARMEDSTC